MTNPSINYPTWICYDCGEKYGRGMAPGHVMTWHPDTCDICGRQEVACTEPRDFGHLRPDWTFGLLERKKL